MTCSVVKELMPNYIDGLTSEETSEDIKRHLADCKNCCAVYEYLRSSDRYDDVEKKKDYEENLPVNGEMAKSARKIKEINDSFDPKRSLTGKDKDKPAEISGTIRIKSRLLEYVYQNSAEMR